MEDPCARTRKTFKCPIGSEARFGGEWKANGSMQCFPRCETIRTTSMNLTSVFATVSWLSVAVSCIWSVMGVVGGVSSGNSTGALSTIVSSMFMCICMCLLSNSLAAASITAVASGFGGDVSFGDTAKLFFKFPVLSYFQN